MWGSERGENFVMREVSEGVGEGNFIGRDGVVKENEKFFKKGKKILIYCADSIGLLGF